MIDADSINYSDGAGSMSTDYEKNNPDICMQAVPTPQQASVGTALRKDTKWNTQKNQYMT